MPTTPPLQALRTVSLRRWVLACVLAAWGCAWAGPLLQPTGLQVVCSAHGELKLIGVAPNGAASPGTADAGDCPLCLLPGLTTPSVPALPALSAAADRAAAVPASSPVSATTGALPPARGPPHHQAPTREE